MTINTRYTGSNTETWANDWENDLCIDVGEKQMQPADLFSSLVEIWH